MIKYLENSEDFEKEIQSGKVLVDFYADWCGHCQALGQILEELEGVPVLKINVDIFAEIAQEFGVMSIPTIILFQDGEQVKKNVGLVSLEELKSFVGL